MTGYRAEDSPTRNGCKTLYHLFEAFVFIRG